MNESLFSPFKTPHHLHRVFEGLLLSLKRLYSLWRQWPVEEILCSWTGMDWQMDRCAQGCVNKSLLKIGISLGPCLLDERLKNYMKIEGRGESQNAVGAAMEGSRLRRERERERADSWSESFLFCPNLTPHYLPMWSGLTLATEVKRFLFYFSWRGVRDG